MTDTPTPAPLVPSERALLPCPFCGAEAEIERLGTPRRSTIYRCTSCACSLETGEEWDHGRCWNTRAERSNPGADVETVLAEAFEWRDKFIATKADVERLRAALKPFAQIAQRKAMLYLRPNDPIVMEAVRALAR